MSVRNKQILIIDDDPEARMLMRKILQNIGLTVAEAESVQKGFEFVAQQTPHLTLVDLEMPGLTGFDFLEIRRQTDNLQQAPVIVVSARQDKESIYRAISLGASDYLIKPYTASILVQKVRKHLKDYQFQSIAFPSTALPRVSFSVSASISKIAESTFVLALPIKLGGDQPVRLDVPGLPDDSPFEKCVFKTLSQAGSLMPTGLYLSRLNAIGMTEPLNRILARAKPAPSPEVKKPE